MFVLPTRGNALFRVIATLVSIALVLWGVGFQVQKAQAANITTASDLLSTSATSTASNHTITFTTPSGVAASESISITFPDGTSSGFTGTSSIVAADIDLEVFGADETLVDGAPAANQWGVSWSGNTLTLLSGGGTATVTAAATATIEIGTNSGGTNQLINPTTQGSYDIDITAGSQDSGRVIVAIVDSVYVTADVTATFDFTVSGHAAGATVNGTTTTGVSTATALPFGTLDANTRYNLAQRLNVTTNAINGFVVTVETDQQLLSSTGADIDGFIDGAYTNTPTAWAHPTNGITNEYEWGHWGLTSEDSDLNGDEFGSELFVSASTTPRQVFSHDGPADGTTDDIGSTSVAYQVEITALQEAADDYSAILTYIATPTF